MTPTFNIRAGLALTGSPVLYIDSEPSLDATALTISQARQLAAMISRAAIRAEAVHLSAKTTKEVGK
ncbi:MAG: hypothetical protein WC683_18600 [bacterium]